MDTNSPPLNPPTRSLSLERQKYFLKPILLGLAIPVFFYGCALIVLWYLEKVPIFGLILGFGIQLFSFLAFWLNRGGKTRSSAYMCVLALFLAVYGGNYYFGVGYTLLVGYAIVALIAGLLIDVMAALFFAFVSMVAYMLIGLAHKGNIIESSITSTQVIINDVIGLIIGLIVLVVFLWLYERQMLKIVNRDRKLNAKIAEANDLLKVELHERTRAQEAIKRKLDFQETITSISARFVSSSHIDSAISKSLGDIVSLCGASYSCLNMFLSNGIDFEKKYEWKTDGSITYSDSIKDAIVHIIPTLTDVLEKGTVVPVIDYANLEGDPVKFKDQLKKEKINSFLIIPINLKEELVGFIVLFNILKVTSWQEEDFTALRVFSEIICNANEKKHLEDQLLQSQKMEAVGRLAGGVAHDFNNILTAIIGSSQLAINSIDPFDPINSLLEDIYRAGEQATALTYQLLAFSRRQMLKPVVLNVNTLINNMQPMLRRLISENIEIITQLDPELGNIRSDRSQIEQVLLNLIVNARDAILEGGKIVIETKNITIENELSNIVDIIPGDYIQIIVNDNGHGMDKEVQSRIFEPFFTTKDKNRGTGLGLSTVYGIIKQSLGKINVYSEPEKGATFKIYLPRVNRQVEIEKESTVISKQLEGTETILVVEDNKNVRELVCKGLRFYSYNVLDAGKPDEALGIFDKNREIIKLVVTDVVMPQMSGQELAEIITKKYPMIKILFISGFTDSAIVHQGILDSGAAFLQKPFTPDKLAAKIREILDTG